jgi:putative ABC transport system ATP-binding protein
MALIEMKNIKKDYSLGEAVVQALRGVDLQIDQGEFVAVWGPSGSGKTTLLNLIGAIDEPTEGLLEIAGQDVRSLSDNQRSELRNETIGFIFQGFNLIPVLSALENVMLPLQIRGLSAAGAKSKALDRLEAVGLKDFIRHRPFKMSGGQQQRVAIARALATDPSLVIADEPTANLDSETARMIIGLMRQLNDKEKTTFIFSTHDQRLLDQVNRLVRLEDGRIVEGGGRS